MTPAESAVPVPMLHELLQLDAVTGRLVWKARRPEHFTSSSARSPEHRCRNWNAQYAGKPALASVDQFGHHTGRIFDRLVYAHRVVYAMTRGRWPEQFIDHINGEPGDNRPGNLRDVPHKVNLRNAARWRRSTSGVTGVSFNRRLSKWMAHITVDGEFIHLGFHVEQEAAAAARKTAEHQHGFHNNHGRTSSAHS